MRLIGSGHSLDLTTRADDQLTNIETIDLIGDGSNSLTLDLSEVLNLSTSTDTLSVIHDDDDTVNYGDGWTAQQPRLTGGQFLHQLSQDAALVEVANTLPFQNPLDSKDVNRNGAVTAQDALQIINALPTRGGALVVPGVLENPFRYVDVSGNNVLSALDALQVINEIARRHYAETEAELLPQAMWLDDDVDETIREDSWIDIRSYQVFGRVWSVPTRSVWFSP